MTLVLHRQYCTLQHQNKIDIDWCTISFQKTFAFMILCAQLFLFQLSMCVNPTWHKEPRNDWHITFILRNFITVENLMKYHFSLNYSKPFCRTEQELEYFYVMYFNPKIQMREVNIFHKTGLHTFQYIFSSNNILGINNDDETLLI